MPLRRLLACLLLPLAAALALGRPAAAQQYSYDVHGRVTQETYPNGTTITYAYDVWGNVTQRLVTSSPPVSGGGDDPGGGGGGGGGFCLATSAYESPRAPQLEPLRAFRERWLRPSRPGRALIELYERFSRPACAWLERSALLRALTRMLLDALVFVLLHPSVLPIAAVLVAAFRVRRRLWARLSRAWARPVEALT